MREGSVEREREAARPLDSWREAKMSKARPTLTWVAVSCLGVAFSLLAAQADAGQRRRRERPARYTGAGILAGDTRVVHILRLPCEIGQGRAQMRLFWSGGSFALTDLRVADCRDEIVVEPNGARANFDSHFGAGFGRYRGREGAYASWQFVDGGSGKEAAYAQVTVADSTGEVVLDTVGVVRGHHLTRGMATLASTDGEDPSGVVRSVIVDAEGRSYGYRQGRLSEDAFVVEDRDPKPTPDRVPRVPPTLHPELEERIRREDPDSRVPVLINLVDPTRTPRFPDSIFWQRCNSFLGWKVQAEAARIAQELLEQRRLFAERFLRDFRGGDHDIRRTHQLWLVNGFAADARLGDLRELAAREDVLSVSPRFYEVPPPWGDGNPANDVAVGRWLIGTDSWANQPGLNGGCFGLIDTGVYSDHVLFGPPNDNIGIEADCSEGGPDCLDSSLSTFVLEDRENHGTGTAGILSANDNLGNAFRGVTDISVDSWKVYETEGPYPAYDAFGAQIAFERAVVSGDRVLVAEIQVNEPENFVTATAANNAFDAGAVVVAAAGNCAVHPDCNVATGTPQPETVRAPANAHKVMAVGAFNLETLQTGDYQGYGPTSDLRIKPDIQAPTDAETASRCSKADYTSGRACGDQFDPNGVHRLGGTSGSTPFAAGAAALIRNWLKKHGSSDPGQTYAQLILAGTHGHPYPEREGAGPIKLPICTQSQWGKVSITPSWNGSPAVYVPVSVVNGWDELRAAIWVPEGPNEFTDIDLYLVDPNGTEVAIGNDWWSVFERVAVQDPEPGTWYVKIKGYTLTASKPIYWASELQGCDVVTEPGELPPLGGS